MGVPLEEGSMTWYGIDRNAHCGVEGKRILSKGHWKEFQKNPFDRPERKSW